MLSSWHEFLNQTLWGNPVYSYCWVIAIILVGLVFKRLLSKLLSWLLYRLVKRYSQGVGVKDFQALLIKPISIFILLLTFYLAFDRLEFPTHWNLDPIEKFGMRMIIFRAFQSAIIVSLTWVILRMTDFFAMVINHRALVSANRADGQFIFFIKDIIKIILISLSFFLMLGVVFHIDVRALITGLGIGGLALALAVKDSLENLLSSVTIFFDKPFQAGDLVKVGNIQGHIETIGFRSTRIRTLDKSFVTVPNKKMIDAELDNLSYRTARRARFTIGLSYKTQSVQVKEIVAVIKKVILSETLVDKETVNVYFTEFTPNALEIAIQYMVNTTSDAEFMQLKEALNLQIMEVVYKHGAEFALSNGTPL